MNHASRSASAQDAASVGLRPESWRGDLLAVVLRVTAGLGGLIYVPSAYFTLKTGLTGLFVVNTAAILGTCALVVFQPFSQRWRAVCAVVISYCLGVGLLTTVGSASQIYLFVFSMLTTLLLSVRWGLGSVALNAVTVLAIGVAGAAPPEMALPRWTMDVSGWSLATANFVLVNFCLVWALGAAINALEAAMQKVVATDEALQQDHSKLSTLYRSLENETRELRRSENDLLESRALLSIAGRTARLGGWRLSVGGEIIWSDVVRALHDLPESTNPTLEEALNFYVPADRARVSELVRRCLDDGTPFDFEAQIVTARGANRHFRAIGAALRDSSGAITHLQGSVQDITQHKAESARHKVLEAQLLQSQKLEAIGSLAGGVAHDFNNLLTVILSYTTLVLDELSPQSPLSEDLVEIKKAGQRAAGLTRQLLAFSRKQMLQPVVLDLNEVLINLEKMLTRLLREDIRFSILPCNEPAKIHADAGQLEQVVVNLVVNARDAMPREGKITIETTNVFLDEGYAVAHAGVAPGPYVMLTVTDTGTGMDRATQDRIFEPFFTTKDKNKGTGLGLAMVYGIVQQSGGHLWVHSEVGVGTTFKIYLPQTERALAQATPAPLAPLSLNGAETILLVEDESQVRAVMHSVLRKYGYRVLEAQNAGEAFLICEESLATIDLLLTDVVMPLMSGRVLAERLKSLRPAMKVLYVSGYTEDTIIHHGVLDDGIAFLAKPIVPEALLMKVRQVLDTPMRPH